MKLDKVAYPYSDLYAHAYLIKGRENRNMVQLVSADHTKRTTTAYARYLMAEKLGRFLTKEEQVDHIDNDKTNDAIDNLQIMSAESNLKKYHETLAQPSHGTYSCYRKGCRCSACTAAYRAYQRTYYQKHNYRAPKEQRVFSEQYKLREAVYKLLGRHKKATDVVYLPDKDNYDTMLVFASSVDFNRFKKCGFDTSKLVRQEDNTYTIPKDKVPVQHHSKNAISVTLTCEFCHKHFQAIKGSRSGEHIYCSHACFAAAQTGKPGKPQKLNVTKEQLLADMQELRSYTAVGKKYSVTGNSIKKRCKTYGILNTVQPIISASMRETAIHNNPFLGDSELRDQAREKVAAKSREHWEAAGKHVAIDAYNKKGELVKHYDSFIYATQDGHAPSHIRECCLGIRKTHHGFAWRYSK